LVSDGLDSSELFRQDEGMAEENWKRLGDYVVARRIALGMRDRRALAAVTGVTDRTLGKVENGRRVSASTLGALDNHLGWTPGSCRQILSGGEPALQAAAPSGPQYDDPTLQHIAEVPGLPPDVVRGLIALARNWREQEDEPGAQDQRRRA
jgi:transcriptional regulator with XRE-family HTH domain